jgi:hypothetical protein
LRRCETKYRAAFGGRNQIFELWIKEAIRVYLMYILRLSPTKTAKFGQAWLWSQNHHANNQKKKLKRNAYALPEGATKEAAGRGILVIDEKNVITSYNQIFCGNAGGF